MRLPDGRRLWIEAVTTGLGDDNGLDRVADPAPRRPVPVDLPKTLLRYTTALDTKLEAFKRYRDRGVVAADDTCVVALNTARMWPHKDGVGLPRLISAMLGIAEIDAPTTGDDGSFRYTRFRRVPDYVRASRRVSFGLFCQNDWASISGVIGDTAEVRSPHTQEASRVISIHNPNATQPLPRSFFPMGTEYHAELGDQPSLVSYAHPAPTGLGVPAQGTQDV